MVKVTSLLILAASSLGFSFGVRAQTEIKIWWIYMPKVASSEKNSDVKGLKKMPEKEEKKQKNSTGSIIPPHLPCLFKQVKHEILRSLPYLTGWPVCNEI